MRAYQFRLATVARIRVLEERVAKDRFMVARRDLHRAQEAEAAARAELAALAAPTGTVTMAVLGSIGDEAARLSESIDARREAATAAASRCGEAQRAWNAAKQRAEVLERLDEQGFARWHGAAQRHEAAELDDLAPARHGWAGARR